MSVSKCNNCKSYYEYKDNLCSNCYEFKQTGSYKIKQNFEQKILNKLHNLYFNEKSLNFLIKIITNNLEITCEEILIIINEFDIYFKSYNAQVIFNILKTENKDKNIKLIHILSYKMLDFWNNKLGGPSCYYDGDMKIPYQIKEAEKKIEYNKYYFNRFGSYK
jgi:hypothetical protein